MGCYDIVMVPCPNCKELSDFQSKGGDCTMSEYTLKNAPADVLMDVNRHSPYTCSKCGTKYRVEVEVRVHAQSVVQEENSDIE